VQSRGEEMERIATVPAIGPRQPDEAVDENSPRADLGGLRQERAVGSLQFLLKELPRGEHHPQSPVTLERSQVPPEQGRVANELIRSDFEQDDHSRLVELAGPAIQELDSERRLPCPGCSGDQGDVPTWNAAEEHFVEPLDSCLNQVRFSHEDPLASAVVVERSRSVRARHRPRAQAMCAV